MGKRWYYMGIIKYFRKKYWEAAIFKVNRHIGGLIGRLLRGDAHLQETWLVILRLVGRILQIQSLMREMPEVFILRIIGFTVNFQRDIVRFCILDLLFAGFEIPNPPGSNDLHARRKLFDRQDRKSTRLNSSHRCTSRMPSSA